MKKVTPIETRKNDHLRINLEMEVQSMLKSGLESYYFIHEALPELDLEAVDTSLSLFGKKLAAPILISSMTGGTEEAGEINKILAEAAQECKIAMGVGSQRAALEDPRQISTFTIARKAAPDILLFANLGAVQLNYGFGIDECLRAVEMIHADALILHLNSLQEAVQENGNTNFSGLAKKIRKICKQLEVPVIVKEVGWGLSKRTARILVDCGVAGIDVAGAGGTSWSKVEMHRAPNVQFQRLAGSFDSWGIPTANSIHNVKHVSKEVIIIASGGLKDGVDIAKCIALGAKMGGMAGPFLRAATISRNNTIELIELTKRQIQVTMFCAGARTLQKLRLASLENRQDMVL